MTIERLQVEEGFLDGLDLAFDSGLNVLIGPRGVGKTSVIELLRFCFGVEPFTKRATLDARQHALSVLGPSGRATVTVTVDGERVLVSRAAGEDAPRHHVRERPIMLSQGEIEAVGVDAAGRLRIIDGFRARSQSLVDSPLVTTVRSLTIQIQDLAREIATLVDQAATLKDASVQLKEAEADELAVTQNLEALRKDQERLNAIGTELASVSVRLGVFDRVEVALERWLEELQAVASRRPRLEQWPEAAAAADPLSHVRDRADAAEVGLVTSTNELNSAIRELASLRSNERSREVALSDEARDLRRRLEDAQEGAGGASRRVAQLRERVGQLSALLALAQDKREQLADLQTERIAALDQLDAARGKRFEERDLVAGRLRQELGPRIHVAVHQDAATAEYASAVASTLRGSGLHYSNLAPMLAERMSPRELVEAIEAGDSTLIATLGGISPDRAARLIEHVREAGCEEILTAPIDDVVEFALLDGKEYKPTEELSTGQRCTVVLPTLLTHRERVLVVDEPEAHLDNAFIVGTVIKALQARSDSSQFIFATHNANIPVLGNADHVIVLGSDGARGFVRDSGPLHKQEIVHAVSSVMEGGREAFERRAAFYQAHPE